MTKKIFRRQFREEVYQRDKLRCRMCNEQLTEDEADAHHITDRHEMPFQGYSVFNGITLCAECHWKAEDYHVNKGLSWEPGYHPDDLYAIIGSLYVIAYEDCLHKQKLYDTNI